MNNDILKLNSPANSLNQVSGTILLPSGREIGFRHIEPADLATLQRFHSRLSERSVYQRFFGFMPLLSDSQAAYFTGARGLDRVALIALDPDDPNEIIGVVRIDREPGTDAAEYAAIVADRWQGQGVAFGLTHAIVEEAKTRGINRLFALVLPDNTKMLNFLRDLGFPERMRFVDGVDRVELLLTPE